MSIEIVLIPIAIAAVATMAGRKTRSKLPNTFCLETQFKDAHLLQTALKHYGCQSVATGAQVDSVVEGARIIFEHGEHGGFDAYFIGDIPVEKAQAFIAELHDEYKLQVQQQTYQNLLARARERGFVLESEEIQEDNSIVLTFTV